MACLFKLFVGKAAIKL